MTQKKEDQNLADWDKIHSRILSAAKPSGTPVEEFCIKRFLSLGLTVEEVKALLKV